MSVETTKEEVAMAEMNALLNKAIDDACNVHQALRNALSEVLGHKRPHVVATYLRCAWDFNGLVHDAINEGLGPPPAPKAHTNSGGDS
jgi:hypothetical protein